MKNVKLLIVFLLLGSTLAAQLKVDVEVRPRFEYRHGYKTLMPDGGDAAAFVSQRTRLSSTYTTNNLKVYVSIQDVRVWGDVRQLNAGDRNGLSVNEAWGEFDITPEFAVKVGRQGIKYDDQRILGVAEWAQQARRHDLLLLKYNKDGFKADAGFAYNQSGQNVRGTTLTPNNTYKTIQYLWLNNKWENFTGSVLFLNTGFQYDNPGNADDGKTKFNQTLGTHLKYKKDKFAATANAYYQMGKDIGNNDLSAYLLGATVNYQVSDKVNLGMGAELQSGNDNIIISNNKNKAFTPFYGTNHRYNGHMDYFYTGNHLYNVGLLDLNLKAKFKLNEKSSFNLAIHNFSPAAKFSEKSLGSEVDLAYSYQLQKNVAIRAGYSHLFASEGMKTLKGVVNPADMNNWGWMMIVINPTIFNKTLNQ